jgi:hypothetical protein
MAKRNFGKYAIIDPVKHDFEKETEWWWKIKPPTSGDELAMSKFLVQARSEVGSDGIRREYPPTNTEIMHREIALTFFGTNIPAGDEKTVEDGGEPYLKLSMTVEQIEERLRQMPHEMLVELWYAVADACPGWGPIRPKAIKETSSSES